MSTISDFKAHMLQGGARPNQFKVILSFPSFITNGPALADKAQFICKAASIPASTVENVQVQYRGRPVNFAGERSFAPWTVSVYTDNDMQLRQAFEQWSNTVQNLDTTNGVIEPAQYQVDLEVHQQDRADNDIRNYKFIDAYPVEVGGVMLDFDAANQIEIFDVTFQYNYWINI